MQVLKVNDWLKFGDGNSAQFKFTGFEDLNNATHAIRLKDGKLFVLGYYVYINQRVRRYRLWYFHPDMKTVEIWDEAEKRGFDVYINYIEKL